MSTNGTKIVGLDQMEYEARLILRQTSAICGRLGTAVYMRRLNEEENVVVRIILGARIYGYSARVRKG